MKEEKTTAAIISAGYFVGLTETSLKNGEHCCYGEMLTDCIHQFGTGKISRSKKWLTEDNLAFASTYDVNRGGGKPV